VRDFYDQVYIQDNPPGESHGWIQWKGTDACIDLHCKCGHMGHHDGMFFYHYECPECGAKYSVGQNVKLIPLNDKQANYVETVHIGFKGDT
jgi:hypothetical protein